VSDKGDVLTVSLIVCMDQEGVIGDSGSQELPWSCPLDLEMFRRLTWGADVVVGRKTWDELPREPSLYQGRRWHVITSEPETIPTYPPRRPPTHSATPCDDWEAATRFHQHTVIAGGASIYEQALQSGIVDRCFVTRLPIRSSGDIQFPTERMNQWELERSRDEQTIVDDKRRPMRQVERKFVKFEEWVPADE